MDDELPTFKIGDPVKFRAFNSDATSVGWRYGTVKTDCGYSPITNDDVYQIELDDGQWTQRSSCRLFHLEMDLDALVSI